MPRRGMPPNAIKDRVWALRRVRLQDKGPAGTQFQVGSQNLAPDPANHQMLFAPVKLEGFTQFKAQRDVGFDQRLPTILAPASNKFGHPAVVAVKARGPDFAEQLQRGASVTLGAPRVDFQGLG